MNNTNLRNSQNFNNSINLNNSESFDTVNLKVAIRPVKFFKLISSEKSKIHDYWYLIEKIRINGKHNNNHITIFFKTNSQDEIIISDEEEWKNYFDSSNRSILELIDSKNTLKIEYIITKKENIKKNSESKINFLIENDKLSVNILENIFIQVIQNEQIKKNIKQEIKSSSILKQEDIDFCIKNFDEYMARLLESNLDKIKNLSRFKSEFCEDFSESSDENNILNVPSFSEYYKNEQIENFRSKMLSETFPQNK